METFWALLVKNWAAYIPTSGHTACSIGRAKKAKNFLFHICNYISVQLGFVVTHKREANTVHSIKMLFDKRRKKSETSVTRKNLQMSIKVAQND